MKQWARLFRISKTVPAALWPEAFLLGQKTDPTRFRAKRPERPSQKCCRRAASRFHANRALLPFRRSEPFHVDETFAAARDRLMAHCDRRTSRQGQASLRQEVKDPAVQLPDKPDNTQPEPTQRLSSTDAVPSCRRGRPFPLSEAHRLRLRKN